MTKRELLEQTFKSKFALSQYKKFTVEFFNDAKLLNGEKRNDYWNWSEYSFYINGYYHVADYVDEKRNKIAIFAVELKKGKSLEKARSKQRNFIADRIKVMGYDGAIAAFYSEDENENRWRLSFVRLDYELLKGKIKTNFTPAKRYSYLLGVDEPCHTAMSQLYPILEEEKFNPSIDKLEEAFSVEKVTKQFFEKYKEKYIELYEYLTQNETFRDEAMRCVKSDNEDDIFKFTEQFAKKLMGQVVFMYFLQKKGWLGVNAFPPKITEREYKNAFFDCNAEHKEILKQLYVLDEDGAYIRQARIINNLSDEDQTYFAERIKGMPWETGPKNFVRILFKEAIKHNRNYFEYYLEPLFYEALNEKREANNFYARLHCRIPFLNGGLFEPLDGYDWRHNNFSIPNEIFSNESIKGEREADGILDIFDRYNFTMNEDEPLEKEVAVDPEMLGKIFENLLDVKDRKSKGAFYTPREIVHYMCQESLINYIVNTVGTPYEDTKDFILYGEIMKDEDCSREVKSGAADMLMPDSIYKNLKAIDDALADVRVADPAVGSGAFPMGMVNEIVKARENITAYFAREATAAQARQLWNYTRHPYMLKKDAMKNSIFAVDIEPSAVDITKLRLWLSLVVEFDINSENEEFRTPPTLPNLECNILCGNSLIDEFEGIKLFNDSLLTGASNNGSWMADLFQDQVDKTLEKLIEKQRELFYANNHDDKYRLKHEIDVLQQQVIFSSCTMTDDVKERVTSAFAMPSKPFILWKLAFAKVFKDKGGFDIVIGNPPYISQATQNSDENLLKARKTIIESKKFVTLHSKWDLYVPFMELGVQMLHGLGMMTMIVPYPLTNQIYAKKLRELLAQKYDLVEIVDLQDIKVFEATVQNCIPFVRKSKISNRTIVSKMKDKSIEHIFIQDENNLIQDDKSLVWNLTQEKRKDNKHANLYVLGDFCYISKGMVLHGEDGSFVKTDLISTELDAIHSKKYIEGKDIDRFSIKRIRYLEWGTERSPKKLSRPTFEELYTNKKLLVNCLGNMKVAVDLDGDIYCEQAIRVAVLWIDISKVHNRSIEGVLKKYSSRNRNELEELSKQVDLRYLVGILNSTYAAQLLTNIRGGDYHIVPEHIRNIPIPLVDKSKQDEIIVLVDKILELKANGENDIFDLQTKIDSLVYELYELSPEEIALVEEAVK